MKHSIDIYDRLDITLKINVFSWQLRWKHALGVHEIKCNFANYSLVYVRPIWSLYEAYRSLLGLTLILLARKCIWLYEFVMFKNKHLNRLIPFWPFLASNPFSNSRQSPLDTCQTRDYAIKKPSALKKKNEHLQIAAPWFLVGC